MEYLQLAELTAEIGSCHGARKGYRCSENPFCGNRSLSTPRFLFFYTTFILSYANCSLPIRNIPVRSSAQVPSALAFDPEQIIPTLSSPIRASTSCPSVATRRPADLIDSKMHIKEVIPAVDALIVGASIVLRSCRAEM